MQFSVVNFGDVDLGNRIDAEYFQPTYLYIENKLIEKHATPLRAFCYITGSAFYPAATHLYETGDLTFIRCVDCIPYPIITSRQDDLFEKIPQAFADEHKNIKRLTKGEIVITKVGTPCYASIIHDINDVALSRTVLGLKHIKNINPYYLVAFLRSKYGFLQLFRERELTIQFQLTLDRVGNVLVFKPINKFLEELIADCFSFHEVLKRKFENLFNEAENLVLGELGLSNWQSKHQLSFVKNYSDTEQADRIDAEYFQPKYDEIVKAIKSYPGGWDALGNLVKLKDKNFDPQDKVEYKYIELSNIAGNGEITDCMVEEGQDLPGRARRKVATGDVIVSSIEGSLSSIALIEKEYEQALCSTGFHIINSKSLNAETLLVFMKSIVGQLQLKKGCSGTILTAINQDEFKQVVLPKINVTIQNQIQQKITESFNLRKQSKHLLECAKRAVEIAIEQGEDKAIKLLQEQAKEAGL
ncbi:MAG: restriction endonuclease subunit S [Nitrospiraceae bacterium]|nr:MAG: restriction endonuclease subunit S [Nitrospiraceae bacterium]